VRIIYELTSEDDQDFQYIRCIAPKRVASLRCPSSGHLTMSAAFVEVEALANRLQRLCNIWPLTNTRPLTNEERLPLFL